jgi:hypothetical protein
MRAGVESIELVLQDNDLLQHILHHLQLAGLLNTLRVSCRWNYLSHARISKLWPLLTSLLSGNCTRPDILTAFCLEISSGDLRFQYNAFNDLCTAFAMGAFAQLTEFTFSHSNIGDTGLTALASACVSGALAQCHALDLESNQIGDVGLKSLADAFGKGALPQCTSFSLCENQIGDAGITALAEKIKPISEGGSGALAQCHALDLERNQIGDVGLKSLADAFGKGAMANCQELWLQANKIGDAGITALAQAIKPVSDGGSGALASIFFIKLDNNNTTIIGRNKMLDAAKFPRVITTIL